MRTLAVLMKIDIETCLVNIAKHFCERTEQDEQHSSDKVLDKPAIPSKCIPSAVVSRGIDLGQKEGGGSDKVSPAKGNQKGCCGKPLVPVTERASGRCTNVASSTLSKDSSTRSTGCQDSCCTNKSDEDQSGGATTGRTDVCCYLSANHEKSTRSPSLDDQDIDASLLCSGRCCGAAQESTPTAVYACSDHIQSAFERFESLIRLGQCLCRKMLQEFDFCCCCGQAAPCSTHEDSTKSIAKAEHKAEPNCKASCCSSTEVIETVESSCEDARCTSMIKAKAAHTAGKDICCQNENAASLGRPSCEDACCERKKNVQTPSCGDPCCAQGKATDVCESVPLQEIAEPGKTDIESAAAREHVVLNVSGMTCTGCSRKMLNVLVDIPAISNPQVTFVSGSAAFDFDRSQGDSDDILPFIEKRTGFKISRMIGEHQQLDMLLDAAKAQAFEREGRVGMISFEKV
jgi:Cd2+-exporting ATPase